MFSSKEKFAMFLGMVVVIAVGGLLVSKEVSPKKDAQQVSQKEMPQQASSVGQSADAMQFARVAPTPDATVDAIVKDIELNESKVLQDELSGEKDAVEKSSNELNTLSQAYDETK